MRRFVLWFAVVLAPVLMIVTGTPAHAELPPRPDGPVLDQAAIIPDADEAALDQKLRAYNRDTGRAVIVATVSSLDGLEVEQYAQKLAETWDIGGAETEQGVLLLVAPNERKIRIHTARGVQERLPDVLAGRIIRDQMVTPFREKNFAGGINAAVDAIAAQLNRDPADAKAIAEAAAAAQQAGGQNEASAGSVIFWILLILFFMFVFGRGGRRRSRRSGIDPGIVLWGISEVLHHTTRGGGSGWSSSGGSDFGGFGGFGGGGGGFDGGGASGDW